MMTFELPYDEDDSSSEESIEDDCPCSCYEAVYNVFSHVPYLLLTISFNSITLVGRGVNDTIVTSLKAECMR